MNDQANFYEHLGDRLTRKYVCNKSAYVAAERAYQSAQNHLVKSDKNYMTDFVRIQSKLVFCVESIVD